MSETYELKTIGHVRSDFPEKFGIPRQAGIVDALEAAIIFEPEYRREEALRGLEGFSHIWVIWQFSEAVRDSWSPTVRPPRLGGNARMGVFATRSPFRPNALGLSCVRLLGIGHGANCGAYLRIAGADMKTALLYTISSPTSPTRTAIRTRCPASRPIPGRSSASSVRMSSCASSPPISALRSPAYWQTTRDRGIRTILTEPTRWILRG